MSASIISKALNHADDTYRKWVSKPAGVPIRDGGNDPALGLSMVGIADKPDHYYERYIREAVGRGIGVIHVLAAGVGHIAKSQRVIRTVVESGDVAVFKRNVDSWRGDGSDRAVDFIVFTLLPATLMPDTPSHIWSPSEVDDWQLKASEYRCRTEAGAVHTPYRP
jgi:hypothetical protein